LHPGPHRALPPGRRISAARAPPSLFPIYSESTVVKGKAGTVDDSTLVGKCLRGDSRSYGQLVDKYSGRILNLGYAMLGSRQDAEDVAQEAFVRAFKSLPRFEKRARFSSWLYQIALNLCRDRLKSRARHARTADEEVLDGMEGGGGQQAPRVMMREELSRKMADAINRLPVLYREAFVLRHLQGVDYAEIGGITGVPPDTVRVRAYRAREMLRELLSPDVDTFWREKGAKDGKKIRDRSGDAP
jgi:RNA polymerase sigma-70 factor (ECF subfamily)